MEAEATWTWFGGVDFEEEDKNTDQMGHITSESEYIHGSGDPNEGAFAQLKIEREGGVERECWRVEN